MRSPPALRELNVGADRHAQLILRIMRIRLSLLEWIYVVSVRYMMNYTLLMKGSETILLKTSCVKEPDILHTMFLFSRGSVSLMMMRTCHVFAARRRSKKKVDCCTCGLLPGE